jgi:hypothetical protein
MGGTRCPRSVPVRAMVPWRKNMPFVLSNPGSNEQAGKGQSLNRDPPLSSFRCSPRRIVDKLSAVVAAKRVPKNTTHTSSPHGFPRFSTTVSAKHCRCLTAAVASAGAHGRPAKPKGPEVEVFGRPTLCPSPEKSCAEFPDGGAVPFRAFGTLAQLTPWRFSGDTAIEQDDSGNFP